MIICICSLIAYSFFHINIKQCTLSNHHRKEVHESHSEMQEHVQVSIVVFGVVPRLRLRPFVFSSFLKDILYSGKDDVYWIVDHEPNEGCCGCLKIFVSSWACNIIEEDIVLRICKINNNTDAEHGLMHHIMLHR